MSTGIPPMKVPILGEKKKGTDLNAVLTSFNVRVTNLEAALADQGKATAALSAVVKQQQKVIDQLDEFAAQVSDFLEEQNAEETGE